MAGPRAARPAMLALSSEIASCCAAMVCLASFSTGTRARGMMGAEALGDWAGVRRW